MTNFVGFRLLHPTYLYYYEESQTTVTNPVVIFEVLSDSTRDYDQGRKFNFYRTLETLQEYVLVDQEITAVMI